MVLTLWPASGRGYWFLGVSVTGKKRLSEPDKSTVDNISNFTDNINMHLCFLLIILILFSELSVANLKFYDDESKSTESCAYIKMTMNSNLKFINELSKKQDVSDRINAISKVIDNCKFDMSKYDYDQTSFKKWEKSGYLAGVENAKKRIEHDSKYKNVNTDLDTYKKLAHKLKANDANIDIYFKKYQKLGLESEKKEKNKCQKTIDLRNDVLGPVRDQDSLGWCYAFADADLLSFKLGKKISAADLAINHNDSWLNNIFKKFGAGENAFEGGNANAGIEAVIEKGACLEENLRSEDNGYADIATTLDLINKNKSDLGVCKKASQALFPNMDIEAIKSTIDQSSREQLVKMLSAKACEPRMSLKNIKTITSYAFTDRQRSAGFNQIDKNLENNNISSIGYDSSILYDKNSKDFFAGHASVIVGRRFNEKNGECEYLVRNSYGRGCSSYDSYYECDHGNIWIAKSILIKGLKSVGYIE